MKIWDKLKQLRHWREMLREPKLKRSGQTRTAPYGSRGRTHALKNASGGRLPDNVMKAVAKGEVRITARHFHADTGKWEELGELKPAGDQNG